MWVKLASGFKNFEKEGQGEELRGMITQALFYQESTLQESLCASFFLLFYFFFFFFSLCV